MTLLFTCKTRLSPPCSNHTLKAGTPCSPMVPSHTRSHMYAAELKCHSSSISSDLRSTVDLGNTVSLAKMMRLLTHTELEFPIL